jgi:branched-chain amino acid transport system substrate-binding protein
MKKNLFLRFLTVSSIMVLAFIFLFPLARATYSDSKQGITDTTIKIGLYGPLTGPAAAWAACVYGSKIVYDDINEKGGIHGRKIITVMEDDACSPEKCKAAVKKLIYDEKVFLIHGGLCSLAIMATKDTIIETGIPYVMGGAALDSIASPVVKNIFNPCLPASIEGDANIRFIASKPGVKNVAIIRHPDEWAMSRYQPMLKKAKELNLKVVADEVMDRRVTDATTQVLKIKQANPDAVMMVLYPAEGGIFIRNAHKFGLDVPIVGTSATSDLLELNTKVGSPEAMKNVYTISGFRGSIMSPEMEKWVKLFQKYYPNLPKDQPNILYGTQGAIVVVKALRDAGKDLSWDKFIAAMDNIKKLKTGVYWGPVSFSPQDHQGVKEGNFVTLVGDKEVYLGSKWKDIKK